LRIYCEAPAKNRDGITCGARIGEHDGRLVLIGLFITDRHAELVFPAPRVAFRCWRCRWWNVFEPVGLPERLRKP
jgi:hypothetical protein